MLFLNLCQVKHNKAIPPSGEPCAKPTWGEPMAKPPWGEPCAKPMRWVKSQESNLHKVSQETNLHKMSQAPNLHEVSHKPNLCEVCQEPNLHEVSHAPNLSWAESQLSSNPPGMNWTNTKRKSTRSVTITKEKGGQISMRCADLILLKYKASLQQQIRPSLLETSQPQVLIKRKKMSRLWF